MVGPPAPQLPWGLSQSLLPQGVWMPMLFCPSAGLPGTATWVIGRSEGLGVYHPESAFGPVRHSLGELDGFIDSVDWSKLLGALPQSRPAGSYSRSAPGSSGGGGYALQG